MTSLDPQLIQDFVAGVVFVGSVIIYSKGRIPQQTIKNLQASNDSYVQLDAARQAAIKNLEDKTTDIIRTHAAEVLQLNKDISDLNGQIKVYKELPLRELADGIKRNNDISDEILKTLQSSANIAADAANDGGMLVKTKAGRAVTVKMDGDK